MDPDTAAQNITFHVAKSPTYGQLYIRGGQVATFFTQNDLELGHVRYESDGSRAGLDNFLFTLSDGRHQGFLVNGTVQTQPAMASIFVKPLVEGNDGAYELSGGRSPIFVHVLQTHSLPIIL